jgi:copper chaperone CopZ
MRILLNILIIAALAFNATAFANHLNGHKEFNPTDTQKTISGTGNADHSITVTINGLVCDFCARALEKVFSKRSEVSGIDVNLESKIVTIGLKKAADIDDATITKLITDAGYNVVKINR